MLLTKASFPTVQELGSGKDRALSPLILLPGLFRSNSRRRDGDLFLEGTL
jgi:hypothetical protein